MNETHLKHLQQIGKIRSFSTGRGARPVFPRDAVHKDSDTKPRNNLPIAKRSEEKGWMHWNLLYLCNKHRMELIEEYKFHPERKWRFDFAIPVLKIGIEYNGIVSKKSRHTTYLGYSGDIRKLNAAQVCGWRVLQYSVFTYRDIINDLKEILT